MKQEIQSLTFPIKIPKAVFVLDSTKLTCWLDCPRQFFYRHVLGWDTKQESYHLTFGSAWHLAMEHLLVHGRAPERIGEAHDLMREYLSGFCYGTIEGGKNLYNAMFAMLEYAEEHKDDRFKVLYHEVAGTVAVSTEHLLRIKFDAVLRDSRGVFVREFKTASNFKVGDKKCRAWVNQWALATQINAYNWAGSCLVPDFWGVEIDGVVFNQANRQFIRVPARRTDDMQLAWLYEVDSYISSIEKSMEILSATSVGDAVFQGFPRNPTACTKYFGCPYLAYCRNRANPLVDAEHTPMEFAVRHWDPTEEDKKAKYILDGKEVKLKDEPATTEPRGTSQGEIPATEEGV